MPVRLNALSSRERSSCPVDLAYDLGLARPRPRRPRRLVRVIAEELPPCGGVFGGSLDDQFVVDPDDEYPVVAAPAACPVDEDRATVGQRRFHRLAGHSDDPALGCAQAVPVQPGAGELHSPADAFGVDSRACSGGCGDFGDGHVVGVVPWFSVALPPPPSVCDVRCSRRVLDELLGNLLLMYDPSRSWLPLSIFCRRSIRLQFRGDEGGCCYACLKARWGAPDDDDPQAIPRHELSIGR